MRCSIIILCITLVCISAYCQRSDSLASIQLHSATKAGFYPIEIRSAEELQFLVRQYVAKLPSDTGVEVKFITDTSSVTILYPGIMLVGVMRGSCKNMIFVYLQKVYSPRPIAELAHARPPAVEPAIIKKPFITVHGNVRYDLNYRSYIDTPFAENDVYQHSVLASLDVAIKDHYPIKISINTHFSNSPLLRNFTNLNFQFNSNQFVNNIKNNLKNWAAEEIRRQADLERLKDLLEQKFAQLEKLKGWLNNPVNYQKIIEERELEYVRNNTPGNNMPNDYKMGNEDSSVINNSINYRSISPWAFLQNRVTDEHDSNNHVADSADSNHLANSFRAQYEQKQKLFDSLQQVYAQADAKYQQLKSTVSGKSDSIMQAIQEVRNIDALRQKLRDMNLPDSALPKGYKHLLAIRSFGIGTMPINYSELSIKNINITGLEAEYNPKYYVAFASGFISYRFRDYFLSNHDMPKQFVTAVRFGKGQVDGNNVIVTWYTGKKYVYTPSISTNDTLHQPRFNVMGFTVESRYQVDKNNFFVAEYAKSSVPYYNTRSEQNKLAASTFQFSDRSNEAYSIKLQSYLPATQTKITANYRRLGTNFQSFSLFTNNATQNSWYVRLSQPFFKRKLTVEGSLRQNDFTNPYVAEQLKTKAVFKSVQATLRIRKWPIVSAGYFPSSQLIKINNDQIIENLFYTLVGTVTHTYQTRPLVYTQFYNKQTDSNFVYFNTKNIMLNQNIYFQKFSMQENFTAASNHYYNLFTIGSSMDYKICTWLTVGGGIKLNHQTVFDNNLAGYSVRTQLKINHIGGVELYYDKGFIPGPARNLVSNEIGRVAYYKTF